jgi:hypothetical protein
MASPFRRNKKERRRWRKSAKKMGVHDTKLEETNPGIAAASKRIAKIYLNIAQSRRKKKPKISN